MTRDFFIFFDNNAQRDLGKIKLEKIISENNEKIFEEIEIKEKCLFCYTNFSKRDNKRFSNNSR